MTADKSLALGAPYPSEEAHSLITTVLGCQWGDEGKGKIVDYLSEDVDIVARVGGGANAGHTIYVDGEKCVFHLIPSGALHGGVTCLISQGVVVHLPSLFDELDLLEKKRPTRPGSPPRVLISDRCHIVCDLHKQLDRLNESDQNSTPIGTTLSGVGPCFSHKMERIGIRVADVLDHEAFSAKYRRLAALCASRYPNIEIDVEGDIRAYAAYVDRLRPIVVDGVQYIHAALRSRRKVLVEAAHGAMLDIDCGTYPYVTSSNASSGIVPVSLGIPPGLVRRVVGVAKAYTTRVGLGPFPTELPPEDAVAKHLVEVGAEFGSTTQRRRRCGWLDLVQLRYAMQICGVTAVAITKMDVLSGIPRVKIAVGYRVRTPSQDADPDLVYDLGDVSRYPCTSALLDRICVDKYAEFPGWGALPEGEALPASALHYLRFIHRSLGVPIMYLGTGRNRGQTLVWGEGFNL